MLRIIFTFFLNYYESTALSVILIVREFMTSHSRKCGKEDFIDYDDYDDYEDFNEDYDFYDEDDEMSVTVPKPAAERRNTKNKNAGAAPTAPVLSFFQIERDRTEFNKRVTCIHRRNPKYFGNNSAPLRYNTFHETPSGMLNGGSSLLLRHVAYRIFDKDRCRHCDQHERHHKYPPYPCSCKGRDKRLEYCHTIVSVHQRSKPHEAVFTITVYAAGDTTTQASLARDILNLDEKEKIVEFSVYASVDDYSTPMYEHSVDLVKKYGINLWHYGDDGCTTTYNTPQTPMHHDHGGAGVQMFTNFAGDAKTEYFVSSFKALIESIMKGAEKVIVNNAPVGRGHGRKALTHGVKLGCVRPDGEVVVSAMGMQKANPHV